MSSRHLSKRIGMLKAQARKCGSQRHKVRKLHLEALEDRRVMATGPTLIALIPNSGVPLSFTNNDVLDVAPRELLFRFSEGQTIDGTTLQQGIRVTRSGLDGQFGNSNDVVVAPGFIGIGDRPREVILRFAETLPDDIYQVKLVGSGPNPLRDSQGNPANGGVDQVIPFELDLGAQVIAVIPQPVGRDALGELTQDRSRVVVYFNADRLDEASAENPSFYRLINRATNLVQVPTSVNYTYNALTNRASAVLQFGADLADGFYELQIGAANDQNSTLATAVNLGNGTTVDDFIGSGASGADDVDLYRFQAINGISPTVTLTPSAGLDGVIRIFDANGNPLAIANANPAGGPESFTIAVPAGAFYVGVSSSANTAYNPVTGAGAAGGATTGAYRLQVSYSNVPAINDDNSTYSTSTNIGNLGSTPLVINSNLGSRPYAIVWPGAGDDPGHRDLPPEPTGERHLFGGADGSPTAAVINYNFQDVYGSFLGVTLHNQITENQKQRAREVFDLYSRYLGVTFRETGFGGLTIATGDPRAIDPSIDPLAVGGIAGGGVAVMNGALNWGNSQYGSGWFTTAMHEIGHLLGLGHSYELPPLTVQGDATVPQNSATPAEPVFPGDNDIVHGQTLFRPDSHDIDLYKFTVTEAGTFAAEITAERTDSNLNSLLMLYREVVPDVGAPFRELIARNDDFYSEDSFIQLHLEPGTYFIGVLASGMTDVDPNLTDSGFGGRSAGNYALSLKQVPPAQQAIVDTTGTPLDGDADGTPGGVNSFWFQSGPTIFVDRANDLVPNVVEGNGSLLNPYDTISAALAAADAQGTSLNPVIVRIVGNGGLDGQLDTAGDARPYLIGFNDSALPLRDGSTFRVPNDVTVMIDAGAVLKLQQANLDAGTTSANVDRARGSIQILGTPTTPVFLTAYSNDTLGGDSDGPTDGAHRGDWGGVVFRDDSDREANNLYLNVVNHANITYGGGKVVVDSVEEIYNPVHMLRARPTVSHNTITLSADAAISADPNSFDDSQGRIGPDVHGNHVMSNTLNGLLVRTKATSGNNAQSIQTVFARWNDVDITHLFTDNLFIQGTPGGRGQAGGSLDYRLQIDPGIVLKMEGARLEANFGAQLIAEGTSALPVVMTSIRDDRFGAGTTFDTNGDDGATVPVPGSWGGLRFNPNSTGNIDWAKIYYGGGTVPIEGDFASFNVVEAYQADLRVANSFLENNDASQTNNDRNGRGNNADTVIFIRGAQPVIVNNVFRNNLGSIININVNAMQATHQGDYGRATGFIGTNTGLFGRTDRFSDNLGPLVRLNRTGDNDINGMEVRGGTLTTEVAFDDTDIVHVVYDEIVVLNQHVYGGVRLQSAPGESLVVKLLGQDAGFTADGVPLDIDDRIGGSVQVLGQPGFPVVLTSLDDCSAGAGFNTDGQLQTVTDSARGCDAQQPIGNSGAVIVDGGDRDDHGFATAGPDNILGTPDDVNVDGWQFIQQMVAFTYQGARNNAPNDVLALGTSSFALDAIESVTTVLGLNLTVVTGNQISTVNFDDYRVIYVPSNEDNVFGGIPQADLDRLALRKLEIGQFVNTGGSLVALTESESPRPYNWLELPLPFTITDFTAGGIAFPLRKTQAAINAGFTISDAELSFGVPYHNDFTGPPGFNGLVPFVLDTGDDDVPGNADDRVITLGLGSGSIGIGTPPRNWRSIQLNQNSNDRNVDVVIETEAAYAEREAAVSSGIGDTNGTPLKARLLGTISDRDKNGDDNRRLGFEVHGTIEFDNPTDVDVYSFNADPGTEVWIDIDRTSFSLDAMIELIDANGNVLARSLDEGTLSGSALPFNKDPYYGRDTFTTNPRDPVMRLVLPAPPGGVTGAPYFIRVRSQPPAADLNNTAAGQTSGTYQMQIRLRQQDEEAGSTIRLSDIRFATIGIEVHGLPYHSPLLGESAEGDSAGNNTFGGAQPLGNLLTSDRNVISVAGDLTGLTDVDWYQFTVDYDLIQVISGRSDSAKTWATMFDIDYADGLTRADLNLSVFDDQGRLIYVGRESNIQDDLPAPGQGLDTDDLSRGSFGPRDPYIGSVQLPAGSVGAGVSRTYFVAVSANRRLPDALNATFQASASSPLIRLEPANSVFRPVEDHIGGGAGDRGTASLPGTSSIVGATDLLLQPQVAPFDLSDVNLFVATDPLFSGNDNLYVVDPKSGQVEFTVGGIPDAIGDITFRSDGHLYAEHSILTFPTNNVVGELMELNFETGAATVIGRDGIPDTNANDPYSQTSDRVDAMAIGGNAVNGSYRLLISVRTPVSFPQTPPAPPIVVEGSRIFELDPNTGALLRIANGFINPPGPPSIADTWVTRGMAFVENILYGVGDGGRFYRIEPNTGTVTFPPAFPNFFVVINDPVTGSPIQFGGLTRGPINVENQAYRNLLFATSTNGFLYCINPANGSLQMVFDSNGDGVADSFRTSIQQGGVRLDNVVGLSFSPLDENLWHITGRRGGDAGHGLAATPDNSRGATETVTGGSSLYFGFDGAGQRNYDNHPNNRDLATNPQMAGKYNAPGGTHGHVTTNSFSLTGSTPADKPTLYFNYFLASDGVDGGARDSARVHVSTNGGATWQLLATNNSVRDTPITGAREGELPPFWSDSITDLPSNTFQRAQELFDNTGVWRQARVDLSNYAGLGNLILRVSFATSGDAEGGTDEEALFGSINSRGRGVGNNFEGFLLDDFIVGYAERGEMATGGSTGLTSFFTSPPATSDNAFIPPPGELNAGAYQLEVRRGLEYGINRTGDEPEINLYDTFLTNDRLHPDFRAPINGIGTRDGRGDLNFIRQQGSVKIEQNIITNVSEVGIVVDNGVRGAGGSLTFPGAVRNVPTLNNERLFPGVVVSNNVIAEFGQAGIRFGGDTRPGGLTVAGVPFGRLMNNTIYGGSASRGVGIEVTDNASPTIMNNILANTATAIAIDASSQAAGTVVGANLFANNGANGTTGTNAIQLAPNDPLFVNPSRRNFYLEDNSLAIDSALNSLSDRPSLLAVKSPLGIQPSPMLAPDRDVLGQLRVDDPTQDPPPGLGANVFKDRGAVERADFVGPSAILRVPIDNDPQGVDQDARETFVIIDSTLLDRFVVKLLDQGGVGIDDLLVSGARFLLTKDGVPLVQGLDYAFVYDNNADEVLFLPSSGVWDYRRLYVLTIDNSTATGILDLAGNALRPNQADGSTRFTIFVGAPIDFGDAPDNPANPNDYPTLEVSNGAGHKFKPSIYLGTGVNPDIVPLPTPNADGDTLDDGLISSSFRLGSSAGQMVVSASVAGKLDAWLDINQDGDWGDAGEYIVSSATPLGQLVPGNNTLNLTLADGGRGASFLRLRFSTAGIGSPTGIAEDGEVEDHKVLLLGPPFQNPINNLDVNFDGKVSPVDALLVINALNRFAASGLPGPFTLPYPGFIDSAPPFLDVATPLNLCTPNDALQVINFLNANAGPQGEGEADATLSAASSSTGGSDSGLPPVLFASSSIVVESKSASGATSSRSTIDDQLFASDNLEFSQPAVSPISAYNADVEDDRESPGEESWDQAVEEFDLGLLD